MWTIERGHSDTICFTPKQDNVDDELKVAFRIVPIRRIHEVWADNDGYWLSLYDVTDKGDTSLIELDEENFFKVIGVLGWKKEEK